MEARRADEEAENEDIDTDDSDLEVVDDPRPADAEDDLGRLIIDAAAIEAPPPDALVNPPAEGGSEGARGPPPSNLPSHLSIHRQYKTTMKEAMGVIKAASGGMAAGSFSPPIPGWGGGLFLG